jgi:hypothetical protein
MLLAKLNLHISMLLAKLNLYAAGGDVGGRTRKTT